MPRARSQQDHPCLTHAGARGVDSARWLERLPAAACVHLSGLGALLDDLPLEQIPAILSALSALSGAAAARMLRHVASEVALAETPDENLSVDEAARRLGVSKDYLYRHAKKLPFTRRVGRRLLFSARGLERWNRRRAPLGS